MSSDRTAQRLSRILAMLPWIIEHEGAEIDDLINRFDYRNRADLVKDLHLVFMTGLPGYGRAVIFTRLNHIKALQPFIGYEGRRKCLGHCSRDQSLL